MFFEKVLFKFFLDQARIQFKIRNRQKIYSVSGFVFFLTRPDLLEIKPIKNFFSELVRTGTFFINRF